MSKARPAVGFRKLIILAKAPPLDSAARRSYPAIRHHAQPFVWGLFGTPGSAGKFHVQGEFVACRRILTPLALFFPALFAISREGLKNRAGMRRVSRGVGRAAAGGIQGFTPSPSHFIPPRYSRACGNPAWPILRPARLVRGHFRARGNPEDWDGSLDSRFLGKDGRNRLDQRRQLTVAIRCSRVATGVDRRRPSHQVYLGRISLRLRIVSAWLLPCQSLRAAFPNVFAPIKSIRKRNGMPWFGRRPTCRDILSL